MRQFLTILLAAVFLFGSNATVFAVEKKEKPKDQSSEKDKKPADQNSKAKDKKPKKKVDDFVDQNKNGIDDRRENLKSKKGGKKGSDKDSKKKPG